MVLTEDGKCTVCGNRDNVIALTDYDSSRVTIIICKDCLIEVLLSIMSNEFQMLQFGRRQATDKNRKIVEQEVTKIIFDTIDYKRNE